MKKINTLIIGTVFIFSVCFGQKETSINYQLNDSIKISSFVSDVKFSATEATAKSKNYKALKA
jgi:hypothetical protein